MKTIKLHITSMSLVMLGLVSTIYGVQVIASIGEVIK